jgi:hypothetical protein
MTAPLRPMNLGEILDRSLQIYRSKFIVFLVVAAIPVLAMELIQAVDNTWLHMYSLVHPFRQPGIFLWRFAVGLAYFHVSGIFGILIEPAFVKLTSRSILGGECSIVSSLRFAAARWRSYLWIAFLKMSAILVAPELVATGLALGAGVIVNAAGGFDGDARWPALLIVALWALVGGGLFLWSGACLSLAIPAAALEDLAGLASLRRSWDLSKGTRKRIWFAWLTIYLSLWVLAYGMEFLLGQTMYFVGSVLHIAGAMRHLYAPAVYILVTTIYALLGPIYPIAVTLIYYDQRIRREGYDIERMMESAGMNTPATLPGSEGPTALAAAEAAHS